VEEVVVVVNFRIEVEEDIIITIIITTAVTIVILQVRLQTLKVPLLNLKLNNNKDMSINRVKSQTLFSSNTLILTRLPERIQIMTNLSMSLLTSATLFVQYSSNSVPFSSSTSRTFIAAWHSFIIVMFMKHQLL
jgi:hypothetical protein